MSTICRRKENMTTICRDGGKNDQISRGCLDASGGQARRDLYVWPFASAAARIAGSTTIIVVPLPRLDSHRIEP